METRELDLQHGNGRGTPRVKLNKHFCEKKCPEVIKPCYEKWNEEEPKEICHARGFKGILVSG